MSFSTLGVASVTNIDGTLTISPNVGAVVVSLNRNNANVWLAAQTFPASGIILKGAGAGTGTFTYANSASSVTLTFPAFTDTLAVLGSTQTFTKAITMNALTLGGAVTGGGQNLNALGNLAFNADNTQTIATATNRLASISSVLFNVYTASADANPSLQVGDGFVKFGQGGTAPLASTLGVSIVTGVISAFELNFQPTTVSNFGRFNVLPGSSSNIAAVRLIRTGTSTNAEFLQLVTDDHGVGELDIESDVVGTGTRRPIVFWMHNTEFYRATIDPVNIFSTAVQIAGGTASATANQIWTASQGAASTTLYIGNASINVTSDLRLKNVLGPSTLSALSIVDQLPVVRFTWNDPSDTAKVNKNTRGIWEFGGVAQDWITHVPWLVNAPMRDCPACLAGKKCRKHPGAWQIDYAYSVPLLVKAIQELSARVTALEGGR